MLGAPQGLPPGLREPAVAQAFRFGRDPYRYLAECERRLGHTFCLRLPGDPPRVVTSNPEYLKQIYALRPDQFASELQSLHINVGPSSVLFLDGERHRRIRKVLTPPIQGEALASYLPAIIRVIDSIVASWPRGETVLLRDKMLELTLPILLETVFGAMDPREREGMQRLVNRWLSAVLSPGMFALSMMTTANRLRRVLDRMVDVELRGPLGPLLRAVPLGNLGRDKAELLRIFASELQRVRASDGSRQDLLARLARAQYEDGSALADDTILDQLFTILVGGHETTASSLSWCFHHLLKSPEALSRAAREARAASAEQLLLEESTPWINACIFESMRLTPVAVATSRTLVKELVLGPYRLPPGTIVWPGFSLSQRRSSSWPDPERFLPERFLGRASPPPQDFMPWGGGVRRCPGAPFSFAEMRLVLARMLAVVDLRDVSGGKQVAPRFGGLTVIPGDGVPVVLSSVVAA